jgi:hypothetical protein
MVTPRQGYPIHSQGAKSGNLRDINDLRLHSENLPNYINGLLSVTFCTEMTRTPSRDPMIATSRSGAVFPALCSLHSYVNRE